MRKLGRCAGLARLIVMVVIAGGAIGATHLAAPVVRAECDGGLIFSSTVPQAQAAIVGRVTSVAQHANGFVDVLGVRVERAYGIRTGAIYASRLKTAWCADSVRTGSRVVVLIGVHIPGAQLDGNYYYVVGQSVTAAEAAQVGSALPDTDAVAPTAVAGPSPLPLVTAGAIGFVIALRRVRRDGARRCQNAGR